MSEREQTVILADRVIQCLFGHGVHIPRRQVDTLTTLVVNAQPAFEDQEHFAFETVFVPNQLTLDTGYFDVLVIDLAHHTRAPVLSQLLSFIQQVLRRAFLKLN